jgi:hypothetical protein
MTTEAAADKDDRTYEIGFRITAVITFIAAWIYCIVTYGFLLGVGLGWLPAIITAIVAGALWPLLGLIALLGLGFLLLALMH